MKYLPGCLPTLFLLGFVAQGGSLAQEPEFFVLNPGPWGEVEAQTIRLVAPLPLLQATQPSFEETVWHFAEPTLAQVADRLRGAGLTEAVIQQLLSPERVRLDGQVWRVRATDEAILGLAPLARADLYAAMRPLAPVKDYLNHPAPIENSHPLSWFSGLGLSQSTIDLATRLCHPRGRTTVLSDIAYISRRIESPAEKDAWLRACEQTSSVVLRLHLNPQSDIAALAKYWSAPGTESSVRALLESLRPRNGQTWIDVAQLLPPMPRSRLYSFTPESDLHTSLPDCRWTAINFFADLPSDRFSDESTLGDYLATSYDLVLPPYRFGDVIVIYEKEGEGQFIHACVYIADDIVFTKNGKAVVNPWIFMRDHHLSRLYVKDKPVAMKGFRRRPISS